MKIIKVVVGTILQFIFSFFRIREHDIFFETCNGEVKDHLKAVYDYAKQNDIQDFRFFWAITKGNDTSHIEKSEIVYKKTFHYYYRLMTCKYWIRTHSVDNIVHKRPGQVYIQMWHGPGATKKEGFDLGIPDDGKPLYHTREWDYYIATDRHSASYIQTATHFTAEIVMLGSARSDELINATSMQKQTIRESLGVKENERLIIYAPTFRDADLTSEVVHLPIRSICKMPGVRVVLRLHPFVKEKLDLSEYGDRIIDGNQFAEINELLIASDAMITDYSSVAIDYSALSRPILFYCYDIELYEKERGFYYDYLDHLGGPLITNEEDLRYWVENLDKVKTEYAKEFQTYHDLYNEYNDGHVCKKFMDMLKAGKFKAREREE